MPVVDLTPDREDAWQAFVQTQPDRTVYHTLAWRDLLAETYRYTPRYLLAMERETVAGVLPLMGVRSRLTGRRLVGLPFSHRVPLLASAEAARALAESAVARAEGPGTTVILRTGDAAPAGAPLATTEDYFITTLDLGPDEDTLWNDVVRKRVRRDVRKAERSGVTVTDEATANLIATYEDLECRTRRGQGAPPYPRGYFARLFDRVPGATLLTAWAKGEPMAGLILLRSGLDVVYGYGASTLEGKRLLANDLLVWRAIARSRADGARTFDFGTTPRHHTSLLRFKEKWGGTTALLPYHVHPPDAAAGPNRTGRAARTAAFLLRHMPMPLFRKVGPWVLRQVG